MVVGEFTPRLTDFWPQAPQIRVTRLACAGTLGASPGVSSAVTLWGRTRALIDPLQSYRQQPWSTYAVHLTTLTAWALPNDLLMVYLLWRATEYSSPETRLHAMQALILWMLLTKWIKLIGHYIRYPIDIIFLPLSILFGYFHGLLKLYAMFTLDAVSSELSPASLQWKRCLLAESRSADMLSDHPLSHLPRSERDLVTHQWRRVTAPSISVGDDQLFTNPTCSPEPVHHLPIFEPL